MQNQYGNCFGLLHDEYITPCRDSCDARFLCREEQNTERKNNPNALKVKQAEAIKLMEEFEE